MMTNGQDHPALTFQNRKSSENVALNKYPALGDPEGDWAILPSGDLA
jgi:hypothetical protein